MDSVFNPFWLSKLLCFCRNSVSCDFSQVHVHRRNKLWLLEWWVRYSSTGMRYQYSGKSVCYFSYFLGYLRCQRTLQPAAHQLRLWRPAHRSRRPHRQILCHPKCYQNGKISLAEKGLQCYYFYTLTIELKMQFSFPVPFPFSLKYRKIPEGPIPPTTPKYAYGRVAMKKVCFGALNQFMGILYFKVYCFIKAAPCHCSFRRYLRL